MRIIEDITYCDDGHPKQMLDLYLPDADEFSVFVFFHGGGLEKGRKGHHSFTDYLVEKGIGVVSVSYRLYPTAVFPEFVRDAAASVAWVFQHIREYGNCKNIFVGGSSAGGYLSMMLCFNKAYLAPYKIEPTQIAGFIHNAGQPTTHFNVLRERGIDTRRVIVDEAAPLYFIGQEPEYAPMLFLIADNDIASRYEQTMLVLSTLKHFGYDQSKIDLKVMHGNHTKYGVNEKGESIFGVTVYEYIRDREKKEVAREIMEK